MAVKGENRRVRPGNRLSTMYELRTGTGPQGGSRVDRLADDIASARWRRCRRVFPPCRAGSVIGIETPNEKPEKVGLREILAARWISATAPCACRLPWAKEDIGGDPIVANLPRCLTC